MRADISPGGTFPDYELPDHTSIPRKLSQLQGEELRRDLRVVTGKIRPDWDLSSPGLREAWNAGDRSHFHGWNKRGRK